MVFAVVIFSLYGKSLFFNWTYYDDDVLILDKQDYFSFSNIKNIFFDTVFGQETDKFCRPVLNLTFLLEKYLYGINPKGYHVTNLIIHLFAVFSVFIFLTLKYERKKTFLLCLLFACHPSIVQAISWVPGRNDSLLTLFVVLSFYFFIKYFLHGNKKIFYVLHLCFFILSLLTKETAIVVPLFYFIFMLYKENNLKKYISFTGVWLFIIVIYFVYRSFVLSYQSYSLSLYSLFNNFVVSLPSLTKYFANIFFPVKLSVFAVDMQTDYLLCLAAFCVFILLFYKFKHFNLKIILFGFFWFIFFLFPTFVMPDNQFYDHRIYLSLVGVLIMLSEIINKYDKINKIICVLLPFFVLFLSITYFYENKFKNKDTFWINALISSPDSDIANAMVAGLFMERKMYKEAEEKYLKAIDLNKNFSKHYVNLSVLYIKTLEFSKAETTLLNALFLDKNNANIYYNLALLYKYKGENDKAKQMKEKYIDIFNVTNKVSKIQNINL